MKIRVLLAAALLVLAAACNSLPTEPSGPQAPRYDESGTMGPDNKG